MRRSGAGIPGLDLVEGERQRSQREVAKADLDGLLRRTVQSLRCEPHGAEGTHAVGVELNDRLVGDALEVGLLAVELEEGGVIERDSR